MANNHTLAPAPLTFELPRTLVDRIHSCRGRLGLKSVSAVVRRALAGFNFTAFRAPRREQCQISVRLSPAQKQTLFHYARLKNVSAGVLLRSALETLSPRATGGDKAGLRDQDAKTPPRKAARKPARKAVGRKPAKKKHR
jgi:hypothetical protein